MSRGHQMHCQRVSAGRYDCLRFYFQLNRTSNCSDQFTHRTYFVLIGRSRGELGRFTALVLKCR